MDKHDANIGTGKTEVDSGINKGPTENPPPGATDQGDGGGNAPITANPSGSQDSNPDASAR